MANLILNRYKPIETAGEGGFGKVIVAWDTRMRRKVAIKQIVIPEQTTKLVDEAGEHWAENVPGLSEARTAAMIQDANIVTVHDFEIENHNAYIIMEYVEGLTLTQFLAEYSDDMTLDMLTCIFSGIAHAIEVAHTENVLHLDIKPDNVLIDAKGRVKVTDFGLATLADEFGYGTANAGTIGYMPPEQMRKQALDARTDLWSLACIAYEMFCGSNPFDAKDIQSSLRKTLDSKLILPSSCWEDISQDVDDVIFKALSPNMQDRYSSVKEFDEALSKNLSNPRAGKKQLSAILHSKDENIEPVQQQNIQSNKSKVLESITTNTGQKILGRCFSSILAIPITLLACLNIQFLGGVSPNIFGIISIVAIIAIAAIWPSLGVGVSSVVLSIALFLHNDYIPAVVLTAVSILWTAYSFKKKISYSNTAAAFSFFGSFGFSQAGPFSVGIFCNIKQSVINAVFGFVICVVLAGLGTNNIIGWNIVENLNFIQNVNSGHVQDVFLTFLTLPSTYIWFIAWIGTSLIVSACFNFNSQILHIVGVVAGIIIMIVGICVSNYLLSNMTTWQPQGWEILPTIAAGAIALIVAIFMPNRMLEN